MTSPETPIDLVLHTPGGLVLASYQIALALKEHPAKTTVIIPHYAMSGGTLIALAADEIIMDKHAVLGPVDPQLQDANGAIPAASILKVVEEKGKDKVDDTTLMKADIAKKAIKQVEEMVINLLKGKMEEEKARKLAKTLAEGKWTHDYPITVEEARELGLPPMSRERSTNSCPCTHRPSTEDRAWNLFRIPIHQGLREGSREKFFPM